MTSLHVVYRPDLDAWYSREIRALGPACRGWERELDHAARLSPADAAYVANVLGGVSMSLTDAWRLTAPAC